jgi:hypothetical protein
MTDLERIYQNGWKAARQGRDGYTALVGREANAWRQGYYDALCAIARRDGLPMPERKQEDE